MAVPASDAAPVSPDESKLLPCVIKPAQRLQADSGRGDCMFEHLHQQLTAARPNQIMVLCMLILGLLGTVDYVTGYEISFSVFYLIPIAIASWYSVRGHAILISILSAILWMTIDDLAGHTYTHGWIPYWNAFVRFGFFMIVMTLLTTLKTHLVMETRLSRTDALTGINNSRAFREWLEHYRQACRRFGQSLALGYIDLDNFKHVNDTMGHSTGDKVLVAVGEVLASAVRSTDIVGRMGGDEFAVILPDLNPEHASQIFGKLHQLLLDRMQREAWPIGFSIGVAIFEQPPDTGDEVIKAADRLMYEVKRSAKNSIRYRVVPVA